jgi:perosamine synthetase
MGKVQYCGPLGIEFRDWIGSRRHPEQWDQFRDRTVYYTHKGRVGLGLLCRQWQLKPGDEVLVPSYNCGSEIDPFVKYGLHVCFYRIDKAARIDEDDLYRRILPKTRLIYVTHYFGWPQDLTSLSEYCRKKEIYLVEDCALSLFSNPNNFPIGVLGDAAIYSFPKSLPVPDGGALVVSNGTQVLSGLSRAPRFAMIVRSCMPLAKRTCLRMADKMGFYSMLPSWVTRNRKRQETSMTEYGYPGMPDSYYYDPTLEEISCSRITRHILRHTRVEEVRAIRRRNYLQIFGELCENSNFRPLFPNLPDGVVPLYLPLLVDDREGICRKLNDSGISAISWWSGYHRRFDWSSFPEARYLKDHLLAIPIHQQLTLKHIRFISDRLSILCDFQSNN